MHMLKKSGDKKCDASDFGKGKSVVSPAVVCFAVWHWKATSKTEKFLYLPESMEEDHVIIGIRMGN